MPFNVTVALLSTPPEPLTLIVDGYGVAPPKLGMGIAATLVKALVPTDCARTVSTKLALVLLCPSLTLTAIVAVPVWFVAGVTVTVRLLPLPPKTILLVGTSVGFEDPALNVRPVSGVSTSPIVNPSGTVVSFTLMV